MGRRRRLNKNDGGELEINRQDLATLDEAILLPSVAVSDEAILFPYVAASDAGGAQQIVSTSDAGGAQQNVAKRNIGTSNEATNDRSVAALDWEIGEHNCALSQLKQKDSIGIGCFRIRGH
jgi:hypothetical protein